MTHRPACLLAALLLTPGFASARQASASMETRVLATYPYGDPDPIPMLVRDARLYPYHAWDGYAVEPVDSSWSMIRLENEHVATWVLPDVGGKLWGAVEKQGGREFVYRNEVMKFRNIALRGPWTSGGIELNFGVIGHAPWTASPVDYVVETHPDGSASVVVGAMDVPSRTVWRVRVRVPAEGAFVQTEALWYNPTPYHQPYYNWMTAAAFARNDLRLYVPGDRYLTHPGEAMPWPESADGRRLDRYAENTFGSHKSFHVVGAYEDFFGGYYEDGDWGFGHWAPYGDMPGQKIWLWALSDEGGIWEDLLTDTDGQYVEWQAGRLLVQYSPGADVNPITQAAFEPYGGDRWTERWFPVVGTGGLSDVSDRGVLYVRTEGSDLVVGINAFVRTLDTLEVRAPGREPWTSPVDLSPLVPGRIVVPEAGVSGATVALPGLGLHHDVGRDGTRLDRPFQTDASAHLPPADSLVRAAAELVKARRFGDARAPLAAALEQVPWHREALAIATELDLREGRAERALDSVRRLLQLDAYDAGANWLAGLAYRALDRPVDAEEAFGWAARSTAWRSAALTQRAELALARGDAGSALDRARAAAAYHPDAFAALDIQAVALRLLGRETEAAEARAALLDRDPLHHLARIEAWLSDRTPENARTARDGIRSELPEQTWLELAVTYARYGLEPDAAAVLSIAPDHPLLAIWRAWLVRNSDPSLAARLLDVASAAPPGFVFPFRPESLPVLEWAAARGGSWAFEYWLALAHAALNHREQATGMLTALDDRPDYGPAYALRAAYKEGTAGYDPESDLRRAVQLDADTWQLRTRLVRHLAARGLRSDALDVAVAASQRFPAVFDVTLARARALIDAGRASDAVAIMDTVRVLPSEGGRTSRQLYEQAHLALALDRLQAGDPDGTRRQVEASRRWPRRLGQGRPYDVDERVQQGLLAWLDLLDGRSGSASARTDSVLAWTRDHPGTPVAPAAIIHPVLLRLGRTYEARDLLDLIAGRSDDADAREALGLLRAPHGAVVVPDAPLLARALGLILVTDR